MKATRTPTISRGLSRWCSITAQVSFASKITHTRECKSAFHTMRGGGNGKRRGEGYCRLTPLTSVFSSGNWSSVAFFLSVRSVSVRVGGCSSRMMTMTTFASSLFALLAAGLPWRRREEKRGEKIDRELALSLFSLPLTLIVYLFPGRGGKRRTRAEGSGERSLLHTFPPLLPTRRRSRSNSTECHVPNTALAEEEKETGSSSSLEMFKFTLSLFLFRFARGRGRSHLNLRLLSRH